MRRHLKFTLSFIGDWHPDVHWYIHADDILERVRVDSLAQINTGATPVTAGTQADPWVLNNRASWLGAMRRLRGASLSNFDLFIRAGGRVLRKRPNGYYFGDHALSGSANNGVWEDQRGAAYRPLGRMFHGEEAAAGGAALNWSQNTAGCLRLILTGGINYGHAGAGSVFSALPMLAGAMFLGEVRRNPRDLVIGLMSLDLVGTHYGRAGTKRYTMSNMFVHPDRLTTGQVTMSKSQSGPSVRHRDTSVPASARGPRSQVRPLLRRVDVANYNAAGLPGPAPQHEAGKLYMVEGKYPPSPGGSSLTRNTIDVESDYIQMKEASIAVRWLEPRVRAAIQDVDDILTVSSLRHDHDITGMQRIGPGRAVTAPAPDKITQADLQSAADEFWQTTRGLLGQRAASFAAMA